MSRKCVEGAFAACKRNKCRHSCCDRKGVEEWVVEYFAFHERVKDFLKSLGIEILFRNDRVVFRNCGDGKGCKFLRCGLNDDVDLRPIDCKIYPFFVEWNTIDFDKKVVRLLYDRDCPVASKGRLPEDFKKRVRDVIRRDFSLLFYGADFRVVFTNKAGEYWSFGPFSRLNEKK
jgi:hypothetical protein